MRRLKIDRVRVVNSFRNFLYYTRAYRNIIDAVVGSNLSYYYKFGYLGGVGIISSRDQEKLFDLMYGILYKRGA